MSEKILYKGNALCKVKVKGGAFPKIVKTEITQVMRIEYDYYAEFGHYNTIVEPISDYEIIDKTDYELVTVYNIQDIDNYSEQHPIVELIEVIEETLEETDIVIE